MKVLVTGGFGWTAESIIRTLHINGYEIVVLDILNEVPKYLKEITNEIYFGDVSCIDDIRHAIVGCEYIIHLAVAIGKDDYKSASIPFNVNVRGTYNVLELAKEFNVKKTIIMSEAPVHIDLAKDDVFFNVTDWKSSDGNDHLYDLTKRLQECIAKDYSDTYNMNIIVLRAGHIVDGVKEIDPTGKNLDEIFYCRGGWVCRYDIAKACLKSLELQSPRYIVFHIVGSYQAKEFFNIERTERVLKMSFKNTFDKF